MFNLVEGFIITNLSGKLGLSETLLSSLLLPSVMLWKKCVEKIDKIRFKTIFCALNYYYYYYFLKKEEQQELKITQVAESD